MILLPASLYLINFTIYKIGLMTDSATDFPLSGVIGIVDSSQQQLNQAVELQLRCVEVRADLLRTAGLSDVELLSLVTTAKSVGLGCLFTLRHADQGGTFKAAESERVALCTRALEAGADIIDLEHGTEAAAAMLQKAAPMILSYHNFTSMLSAGELASLTIAMEQQEPTAIKIIPTGGSITDAATMLTWVGGASSNVRRIGFAMGSDGATSRILTMAHGAPITYASFGEAVAPGQVDIALLLNRYQCMSMNSDTKIVALVGDQTLIDQYVENQLNASDSKASGISWLGFAGKDQAMVEQHKQAMKISDIHIL